MRDTKVGIIVAGALCNHVREALPEASTLKLGLTWPLPPKLLASFAASVEKVYVVEESCRYFRDHVAALGIALEPPAAPSPAPVRFSLPTSSGALALPRPRISRPRRTFLLARPRSAPAARTAWSLTSCAA